MTRRYVLGSFVGILLVGLIAWQRCRHEPAVPAVGGGTRGELVELTRAVGAYRPLEARLTGGFAYGAIPAPASTNGTRELEPDVRIAIAKIEKNAASAAADERDWAALGTAYVVAGEIEKGLQFLEAAVTVPIPSPMWLSDLAGVYLTVAQQRDRPDLMPKALAAAEKATRLNSGLREAAFNKALTLEAMHLNELAEAEWNAYRLLDRESPWNQEALAHVTRLEQQRVAAATRWDTIQQAVENDDAASIRDDDALKSVRYRLRSWIEMAALPGWAERELRGDRTTSEQQLHRARIAADLLMKAGGDQMPRDAIRAIDRALQSTDKRAVIALAKAHLAFRDVVRLFEQGNVAGADLAFRTAEQDFAIGRTPYVHWSPMYRAIALYAARKFDDARLALETGDTASLDAQYRGLAGRRKWLIGLILGNQGHLMASLANYRQAHEAFQSIGESGSEASVTALLGEVLGRLGSPTDAWRYEVNALGHAVQFGLDRSRHLLLLKAGGVLCLNADQPEAALHFQNAVLALSTQTDRASALVEAQFNRAQINERLGDMVAARHDLDRAKSQLARIVDQPLRRREEAEVLLAEAHVLRIAEPARAIAAATATIDFFRDSGGEARMIELHLARGRAYASARQYEQAETDLAAAIQHFESQRNRMADRAFRASFFRDGSRAFAEMARVQVDWRRNAAAALEYAERGRARTLLEAATGIERIAPLTVTQVQQRLPDRVAAVFFSVFDDRLLVWTVRRGSVVLAERPLGAAALRTRIDRSRWLIRQPGLDPNRVKVNLEDLFRDLFEPVQSSLDGVDTIAVIPDGPLHSFPFAALRNPKTSRYVVQDYVLLMAPSLSTLVRNEGGTPRTFASIRRALVIGNPAHKPMLDEVSLPDLPFSQEESEAVAATYRDALLLTREKATKHNLLQNLARFDVVHYAGHAVVNDQTPSLSRLLVAQDDRPDDDGALFVTELAGLRLDSASIVVLAACSTAAGNVSSGEGIASIARPFLEAGAATVVATLWDVQDRSAAELFQQFHRRVARGESASVALTAVQRTLIEDPSSISRAPAQWAWPISVGALPSQ